MESLNINEMLRDDVTKITNSLIPPGFVGDGRSIRFMQDSLSKVINMLGERSAAAQGLSKVITTAERLRSADSHTLYLLKDAKARNGRGEVLGMLKVGRKHLYLFDEREAVREVEPLCVLDFYVLEEKQRRGVGKVLFDHMLQDMNVRPHQLAVDGPSSLIAAFLRKNYGFASLLRQSNNFAVSPRFFAEIGAQDSKPAACPPSQGAVGRHTATKPSSSIGNVIHGDGQFNPVIHRGRRGSACTSAAVSPHSEEEVPEPTAEPVAARCSPARPRTLPVSAPTDATLPSAPTPAGAASRRDSQLTDKGFFDVKFYHKKLW